MTNYILEACVDSVESALSAYRGGADRLELCAALVIGGITPDIYTLTQIKERSDIKTNVLIRPRFGDFCYSDYEFEQTLVQVKRFAEAGANGIVIGALTPEGSLDIDRMSRLIEAARGLKITLHRAFDQARNPFEAMEDAIKLGVNTILTSGQKISSLQGAGLLRELAEAADDRIDIMAGGGIDAAAIKQLHTMTGLTSYHMSGKKIINSVMKWRNPEVKMGLPAMSEYEIWQTDEQAIREARIILNSLASKHNENKKAEETGH